ncbi:MAG TPA: hypothetical protein VFF33_06055 [Ignavibacteriaceae bacterium]|nr:hypothetical protein [Ignavibacteriaceae bacterium]
MPICPNCEYEYVEGVKVCPDCGYNLVPDDEVVKAENWSEDNWEVVYTSTQEYEIEMLKDNLESAGIVATILSQKDRNFPAPGDFSMVKLLVQKQDVDAALTYIEEYKRNTGDNLNRTTPDENV